MVVWPRLSGPFRLGLNLVVRGNLVSKPSESISCSELKGKAGCNEWI